MYGDFKWLARIAAETFTALFIAVAGNASLYVLK